MDESIKNAEKLIEAANTVLARMKYDASYDDFNCIMGASKMSQKPPLEVENFWGFAAKENVQSLDEVFPFDRRSLSANSSDAKIEEINQKIESYKQGMLERAERESLRALHFDRGDMTRSRERIVPAARTASDSNLSQRTVMKAKPSVTENLKIKLLQTQEVVDRGIQTARQLSERVDVLKMRPLKTDRYDEVSLSKSRSSGRLDKSDSRSTVRTYEVKRCRKCNNEISPKKGGKQKNVLVVRVRGRDQPTPCRVVQKKLNLQELPSLDIRGNLRCQKIPSVDIPPEEEECLPVRTNTRLETYSHDQILRDRIDRIIEDLKKSDSFTVADSVRPGRSVECSHCGKVTTVRDRVVDSRRIDELLKMCDYNVFDPRIDEFVEGCNVKMDDRARLEQTGDEPVVETVKYEDEEVEGEPPRETAAEKRDASPVADDKPRISDLSEEITRMYRQKAVELESDHLQFESILRDLFDKVDESRSLFKDCDYLKSISDEGKRSRSLTVTTPVVLSYTGSGEEADDGRNAVLRPNKAQRHKMSSKDIRKKLERKELQANCKLLSSSHPSKDKVHVETEPSRVDVHQVKVNRGKVGSLQTRHTDEIPNTCGATKFVFDRNALESPVEEAPKKESIPERKEKKKPHIRPPIPESKQTAEPKPTPPQIATHVNLREVENLGKPAKGGGSDYESDFEEDSVEDSHAIMEVDADDTSYRHNVRLSTISEVDSRMSDLVITPDEEVCPPEPKPEEKKKTPPCSMSSDEDDDTRKLLKSVNRDLEEVVSQQLSSCQRTGSPREVTEPLKEVLNALKNQFERTELLADKLTESIKEVNDVKKQEAEKETCLSTDVMMVGALQRVRNNVEKKHGFPVGGDILQGLRFGAGSRRPSKDEGDEAVTSDEKSKISARKHDIPKSIIAENMANPQSVEELPKSTDSESSHSGGKSYSEGEISEQEIMHSDRSSPSIGEVISENESVGVLSEDNSVIKFL